MTRKFVVMTIGRTGSTSLMENLERYEDIAVPNKNIECVDNELIQPYRHAVQIQSYSDLCKKKINNEKELIEVFFTLNEGYAFAGFKSMPNRHPDYKTFVSREDIQFITLGRRDIASTVASFHNAKLTGSWRRHGETTGESWRFEIKQDAGRVKHLTGYVHQSYTQLAQIPRVIKLFYEDLCDPQYTSVALDAFFNRHIHLDNPRPPTSGANYVANWDEFREFVEKSWKQLARQGVRGGQSARTSPASMKKPAQTVRQDTPADWSDIIFEEEDYSRLESFCLFIGYPRSGHSLVGALLDAHPDMVIANELDVLKFLGGNPGRDQVFSGLIQNARSFAATGCMSGKYSYAVPDQWQGRTRELKVIGDKKGGMTSVHVRRDVGVLEQLQKIVNLPLKIIHVYRNPFDNIATLSRNETSTVSDAINLYFSMVTAVEAVRSQLPATAFYEMRQESFIDDPKHHLAELCTFLGQKAEESYLNACASIVYKSPHHSRADVDWTAAQIAEVRDRMAEYPFLKCYLDEGDLLSATAAPRVSQQPARVRTGTDRKACQHRIMYAWELGMDLGHIMRFLPLGMKLRDRGYEVVFAIRELTRAESAIGVYGFPVVQAPIWLSVKNIKQPTLNYSDIIVRYGFMDATELKGLVKAWRQLFQYTGVEMVIADHSPSALLAVRTMGLKCATIGTGFCSPPHKHPVPNMRPWVPVPDDKLLKIDNIVVSNSNRVIADLGGKPIQAVSDLFKVDEEFITSFPELDHYSGRGKVRYWGPGFNVDEGETMTWPEGKGQRIFAYLKPRHADFEMVLKVLNKLPARVLAYTPGIPAKLIEQYQTASLRISQKPLKLATILRECDLVISHAGNGTVAATLLAGIPQLLLPTQLEQMLLSRRIVELGAGLLAEGSISNDKDTKDGKSGAKNRKPPDYGRLLNSLLKKTKYRQAAQAFAKKYARFNQSQQISLMASRVEEILTKS